jgi:DNA repair protein SbcD/Mre11
VKREIAFQFDELKASLATMVADFSFIHAADVHLDSPLAGLAAKDEAFSQLVRGATRRALANVIDLAISEGVSFVVIAGDLYDGTWKDHATGQFAVAQLARLTRAGIRAFIVFGNHDAESRVTRHLTMPDGVYSFSNRKCETIDLPELGVAIHGRSYKEAATFENIASTYCPPTKGRLNLAILHTALEGAEGHARYAPCSVDELRAAGHDYWALGHVHEASVRSTDPHIVFPGNTQGRHVRETGAKGAMIVRVEDGVVRSVEPRACDEVRWAKASIDAAGARDMTELLSGVSEVLLRSIADAGDRPTATRLTVTAAGPLRNALLSDPDWFSAEVRAQASAVSDSLWLEKIRIEAPLVDTPVRLPAEISDLLSEALEDPDCAKAIDAAIAPLLGKLPSDIGDADTSPLLAAARARDVRALIGDARSRVAARFEGEAD